MATNTAPPIAVPPATGPRHIPGHEQLDRGTRSVAKDTMTKDGSGGTKKGY